ncbi:MAG TPA: LPS export ABC transporter periplasmic protein LptC [Thermohalobaculum sp.]|nr:LPS export ABC transporter periplasmic protein LptC [Thermohalobaculum sp.]
MQRRADSIERRQARLQRRARLVGWAKWLLPLGALGLIAAIFLAGRETGHIAEVFTPEEIARLGAGLRLDNPRLAGVTERDQPYELTASAAVPDGPMAEEVTLEQPKGWIEAGERRIDALAETAHLNREARLLTLYGGVEVETSDGWQGATPRMTVELAERRAAGPEPVRLSSPRGTLEAGSFRVEYPDEDAGGAGGSPAEDARIWFENGVRLRFTPRAPGSGDDADPTAE